MSVQIHKVAFSLLALVAFASSASHASGIFCSNSSGSSTLQDLIGGASIAGSGICFANWSTPGADLDLNQIFVSLADSTGLFFDGGGEFAVAGYNDLSLEFTFDIVLESGVSLEQASLHILEPVFAAQSGVLFVDEFLYDGGTVVETNSVIVDPLWGFTGAPDVSPFFPSGASSVRTNLFVRSEGDAVSLNGFTQLFATSGAPLPPSIPNPEPAAALIFGANLAVVAWALRRRRRG